MGTESLTENERDGSTLPAAQMHEGVVDAIYEGVFTMVDGDSVTETEFTMPHFTVASDFTLHVVEFHDGVGGSNEGCFAEAGRDSMSETDSERCTFTVGRYQ